MSLAPGMGHSYDLQQQIEMLQREIERLQAENAELQIFKQMWNDFVSLQHGDAQLLCKDAERYRWLRYAGYGFDIAVCEEDGEGEQWVHGYPPEDLDAAIDAAMKGGE